MKKTVLLTGASRGIGKAIADTLQKKYTLITPTRKELDLISDSSIERFTKKHRSKKVDIIINNAGINFPQWIEEMSDDNISQTVQTNLIAPIKLIRGFVHHMIQKRWGRIINISSTYGLIARGKQTLYAATKHGINGVTKALALELAPHNILVNSVCPGFTKTEMVLRNPPEKIKMFEADIPLGRLAEPKEIAHLVEFLISSKCNYITGTTIVIDGGLIIK